MGTRVPGYPHLKLTGTQVSLPGPGYIITSMYLSTYICTSNFKSMVNTFMHACILPMYSKEAISWANVRLVQLPLLVLSWSESTIWRAKDVETFLLLLLFFFEFEFSRSKFDPEITASKDGSSSEDVVRRCNICSFKAEIGKLKYKEKLLLNFQKIINNNTGLYKKHLSSVY